MSTDASGFDSGIQSEELGLKGDVIDQLDDLGSLYTGSIDIFNRLQRDLDLLLAFFDASSSAVTALLKAKSPTISTMRENEAANTKQQEDDHATRFLRCSD